MTAFTLPSVDVVYHARLLALWLIVSGVVWLWVYLVTRDHGDDVKGSCDDYDRGRVFR